MDVDVRDAAGGRVILSPAGELDRVAADHVERAFLDAVGRPGAREVLVDLTRVSFLDSTGIRVLLRAADAATERGVRLRVTDPQPVVARILRITAVGPVLGWADDEAYRPAGGVPQWRRLG
ncbi:STAS domain-containing protein [Micromonospora mirobrigensis]|uniref:Anti-sigma factor antagonist n=1 Tax=Micromonospora mirobrigensis TaxID=262898 RepID=A0A1C4U704_9ACTN|nr:STAS domain-containing protein [Micromonospora mirobrigensis]SCE67444.1 anti-sigma B factor antagonist [Micromonospora mirobrigensis]